MKYLIIYDYDSHFVADEMESPIEAMLALADEFYDGEVPDYMKKAVLANEFEIADAIKIFNILFQQCHINFIYKISDTVYDEDRD
jgi:hypothetical protein